MLSAHGRWKLLCQSIGPRIRQYISVGDTKRPKFRRSLTVTETRDELPTIGLFACSSLFVVEEADQRLSHSFFIPTFEVVSTLLGVRSVRRLRHRYTSNSCFPNRRYGRQEQPWEWNRFRLKFLILHTSLVTDYRSML